MLPSCLVCYRGSDSAGELGNSHRAVMSPQLVLRSRSRLVRIVWELTSSVTSSSGRFILVQIWRNPDCRELGNLDLDEPCKVFFLGLRLLIRFFQSALSSSSPAVYAYYFPLLDKIWRNGNTVMRYCSNPMRKTETYCLFLTFFLVLLNALSSCFLVILCHSLTIGTCPNSSVRFAGYSRRENRAEIECIFSQLTPWLTVHRDAVLPRTWALEGAEAL